MFLVWVESSGWHWHVDCQVSSKIEDRSASAADRLLFCEIVLRCLSFPPFKVSRSPKEDRGSPCLAERTTAADRGQSSHPATSYCWGATGMKHFKLCVVRLFEYCNIDMSQINVWWLVPILLLFTMWMMVENAYNNGYKWTKTAWTQGQCTRNRQHVEQRYWMKSVMGGVRLWVPDVIKQQVVQLCLMPISITVPWVDSWYNHDMFIWRQRFLVLTFVHPFGKERRVWGDGLRENILSALLWTSLNIWCDDEPELYTVCT